MKEPEKKSLFRELLNNVPRRTKIKVRIEMYIENMLYKIKCLLTKKGDE